MSVDRVPRVKKKKFGLDPFIERPSINVENFSPKEKKGCCSAIGAGPHNADRKLRIKILECDVRNWSNLNHIRILESFQYKYYFI